MENSMSFEIDSENSVTIRLNKSRRLSLSDITAATIGEFSENDIADSDKWMADNLQSEGCSNQWAGHENDDASSKAWAGIESNNVLRPWEDHRNRNISPVNLPHQPVTHSTHPLMAKRSRDEKESHDQRNYGEMAKRQRCEPDSTTQPYTQHQVRHSEERPHVYPSASGLKTSEHSDFNSAMGHFLSSLQQASMPVPATQEKTSNINPSVPSPLPPLQDFSNIPKEKQTPGPLFPLQGTPTPYNATQSSFPWMPAQPVSTFAPKFPDSPPKVQNHTGSSNFNFHYPLPSFSPLPVPIMHESVQQSSSIFLPSNQAIPKVTSAFMPPKTSVNSSISQFYSQLPSISPQISKEQELTKLNATTTLDMKKEPSTPVGKTTMHGFTDYVSPAMDSRFSESLSNLLGSPPPDSPLSKNPFFGDLQSLLNNECKREIVPQSLFEINPKKEIAEKKENVFSRERNLQERFSALQSSNAEEVRQLSSVFRYQSALIETERFRTLHESQYPSSYKESVNQLYDDKLHKVMDRVERSVQLLENSNKENKPKEKVIKPRPHLNREAIRMMENWYSQNIEHPYPTSATIELMAQTGNIGVEQVKKWFANKRNRSQNTRSLTEIAIQKRKLGHLVSGNYS